MRARDLTDDANRAAELPWREPGLAPRVERVALFRNRALDFFTRSHPATPYLVGLPLAALCGWQAATHGVRAGWGALLFALGWLTWALVEYLMHRFLFHAKVEREGLRIATLLAHGHHHVWPQDPSRIAATPVQLLSTVLFFVGVLRFALGPDAWWAAMSGAMAGYVAYEAVHWMAHHGRPRSRVLRALKAHHMRHHHLTPHARWGIGTPLFDWIFRTDR